MGERYSPFFIVAALSTFSVLFEVLFFIERRAGSIAARSLFFEPCDSDKRELNPPLERSIAESKGASCGFFCKISGKSSLLFPDKSEDMFFTLSSVFVKLSNESFRFFITKKFVFANNYMTAYIKTVQFQGERIWISKASSKIKMLRRMKMRV